jgi:glycine hydroxymethyltransferase
MCKKKYAQAIDRSVFPGMQGGPHDHITAAKAVCFKEALAPSFKEYARNVITNAKALCSALQQRGYEILTGGTDNHLMVVDLRNRDLTGKIAESTLEKIGVSCSRSTIPFDTRKAMNPSGIRLGTPAVTSRNMGAKEMEIIAEFIDRALVNRNNNEKLTALKKETTQFCQGFPLYR